MSARSKKECEHKWELISSAAGAIEYRCTPCGARRRLNPTEYLVYCEGRRDGLRAGRAEAQIAVLRALANL
jgi:hypothetical protein